MRHLLLTLVAFFLAVTTTAAPPTVSRETTYYLGPLDDEGYVDYVAALDKAFGDVEAKPEDNVFVGILENVDTSSWDQRHVAALWQKLNATPPDEGRVLFTRLPRYAETKGWDAAEVEAELDAVRSGRWSDEDYPRVGQWLDEMDPALDAIASAMERSAYFSPLILDPDDPILVGTLSPHLSAHRAVARSFGVRINRLRALGDYDAVVRDLVALERFARWQSHEPTVIAHLVAISFNALGHGYFTDVMATPDFSIVQLNRLRRERERLPSRLTVWKSLDESGRVYAMDMLTAMARDRITLERAVEVMLWSLGSSIPEGNDSIFAPMMPLFRDPHFDLEMTLRRMNEIWSTLPQIPENPEALIAWSRQADLVFSRLSDEAVGNILLLTAMGKTGIPDSADPATISKAAANMLAHLSWGGLPAAIRTEQSSLMQHQLEDVVIALAIYRLREKNYPVSLDALTPKYLKQIPVDFVNGEPLKYCVEGDGYLLYSIGIDGEDDGGLDDVREGDTVVRVGPVVAED